MVAPAELAGPALATFRMVGANVRGYPMRYAELKQVNSRIVLLPAIAVSAAFSQEPARPVALTPAQTLNIRQLSALEFSPDGLRLALQVREPAKGTTASTHVWVLDVRTSGLRQWTSSSKSDTRPHWSPDGRKLAFVSNREERAQIYWMRVDGGEAEKLTDGKNAVQDFRWSPDGKQIAFLAGEPKTEADEKKERDKDDARVVDRDDRPARIWVADLESHKVRPITKDPWRVQELNWLPGEDRLLVKATDHPESEEWKDRIYSVSLSDGQFAEIAAPRGDFRLLKVAPDGRTLAYLAAPLDGPSTHDLFVRPLNGSDSSNITGSRLDRPVHQYEWRPDGSLVAITQNGLTEELHWIKDEKMERMFSGFKLQPMDFASNREGAIALVAADSVNMPELWLSLSGAEPKQVSHFNDGWRDISLRPVESIRYRSFDGTVIEAGLIRPAGAKQNARLPLIVMVHGGPTGAWSHRFNSWGQLLAARGYLVLCPNIRGSTGYGHKFVEMNRADWGGGDFKDVMAGVDWLIQQGEADPERLGIGGWSYGGYMAAWAITQTNRFKAAVAGAGMSDLASEFGTEQGPAYDEWFFGTPYEHLEAFRKSSPITYIKNARTPTLILQGEADKTDPIGQSQQLYRALKRYGVKSDFVVYPREPHAIQEEKHSIDVLDRMLAWFDAYLK